MLNATRVRKAKNVCIYTHTYLYLFLYLSLHIDNMSLQSSHEFHSSAIVFIRPFTLSYLYSPSPGVRRLPSRIYRNLLICSTFLYVDRLQTLPVAASHRIFPLWSSPPPDYHASMHQCPPWTNKVVLRIFLKKLGIQNFFLPSWYLMNSFEKLMPAT